MVRLALPAILTAAGRVRFFRETRQQLNGGRAARLAKLDCSIGQKIFQFYKLLEAPISYA